MSAKGYSFPRSHRLTRRREFDAVYHHRLGCTVGPLRVIVRPNELGHHRLGMSVPARVGTAVRRHRIRRLLREAFRLNHRDWSGSHDIVVNVRPHEPLKLTEYEALLRRAVGKLDRKAVRKKAEG